jgi:quinol monooxygenase YgiN
MSSDPPNVLATKTVTRLTTLDPDTGYITTMNTYTVAPEHAENVLDHLVRSAREAVRYVPGFVSFNFHVSLDRTQIVNYGQWKSREAIAAARENPKIRTLMSKTAEIAGSSKPIPYELRKSVAAADPHEEHHANHEGRPA